MMVHVLSHHSQLPVPTLTSAISTLFVAGPHQVPFFKELSSGWRLKGPCISRIAKAPKKKTQITLQITSVALVFTSTSQGKNLPYYSLAMIETYLLRTNKIMCLLLLFCSDYSKLAAHFHACWHVYTKASPRAQS